MQGEVSPQRGNVMRGDAEKGGSYRCAPKLVVPIECLCCDRPRGPSSLFPIPSPTLRSVPAPLQLWMLAGAHGTGRLPSTEPPVSAVSLGCSFSPGWGGFCSTLVRKQITGRNKGDFVWGGDGYLSLSSSLLQPRAMLSLSGGCGCPFLSPTLPSALTSCQKIH